VVRHVVGHHHALVADFLQGPHDRDHVHVAFVGEDFLEVVAAATDVADVDVEDLLPRAEVADDVVDLGRRLLQHLGGRAQAQVQPVVRALLDGDEALHPSCLYLAAGMPARAQLRMIVSTWSISRWRSGSLPSITALP
jgi:hypothetical protein